MISFIILVSLLVGISGLDSEIAEYTTKIYGTKNGYNDALLRQLYRDYQYRIFDSFIKEQWGKNFLKWEVFEKSVTAWFVGKHKTKITFIDGTYLIRDIKIERESPKGCVFKLSVVD